MTNDEIEKLRALCDKAPRWIGTLQRYRDGECWTEIEQKSTDAYEAMYAALPAALDALEQARRERDDALAREWARPHWADCAVNHGGAACDMGPECGLSPEERALMLSVERRIATWLLSGDLANAVGVDLIAPDCPIGVALTDAARMLRSGAWKGGAR